MKRYKEMIDNALQKNIKTASILIHKTNMAGEISISYWTSYQLFMHDQKLGKSNQNYLNCSRMKSTALIITSLFVGWIIPSILFPLSTHMSVRYTQREQAVSQVNKWYSYHLRLWAPMSLTNIVQLFIPPYTGLTCLFPGF